MRLPVDDTTLFLAASAALLWASRRSLRKPGSHGYFRFFGAELTLLVIVINRELVGDQTIANALLYTSATLGILGYLALRRFGAVNEAHRDDTLLAFEKTTRLVTGNIFRFIRHPMYASLIALVWGFFFRDPSPVVFGPAALASVFFFLTARADERECLAYFGTAYADYMRRTRRFIPYVF